MKDNEEHDSVREGICPYCKKLMYISDTINGITAFECMNDNRLFTVKDVDPSVIKRCNDKHGTK